MKKGLTEFLMFFFSFIHTECGTLVFFLFSPCGGVGTFWVWYHDGEHARPGGWEREREERLSFEYRMNGITGKVENINVIFLIFDMRVLSVLGS